MTLEWWQWRYIQGSSVIGTSPSDYLASYLWHSIGVLPLCRGAVGVFYKPSRLGKRYVGHKDKLIGDGDLSTPTQGRASVGRTACTYLHQLCAETRYSLEDLLGARERERAREEREREREREICQQMWMMMMMILSIFTNPSARVGYDTRSIFKRSLTGLNSEFSFS